MMILINICIFKIFSETSHQTQATALAFKKFTIEIMFSIFEKSQLKSIIKNLNLIPKVTTNLLYVK